MAKMKIVGITERKGNYEGKDYHNLVLNLEYNDLKDTIGKKVETAKIKWASLADVFDLDLPDDVNPENYYNLQSFTGFLGCNCHIYYDKYRNAEQVIVEDKPDKPDKPADYKSKDGNKSA